MTSSSNGHANYKVVLVGTVQSDLKQYHQQLMQLGKGAAFVTALAKIHDRLHLDPYGFGEKLYRLPALRLLVHQGSLFR